MKQKLWKSQNAKQFRDAMFGVAGTVLVFTCIYFALGSFLIGEPFATIGLIIAWVYAGGFYLLNKGPADIEWQVNRDLAEQNYVLAVRQECAVLLNTDYEMFGIYTKKVYYFRDAINQACKILTIPYGRYVGMHFVIFDSDQSDSRNFVVVHEYTPGGVISTAYKYQPNKKE